MVLTPCSREERIVERSDRLQKELAARARMAVSNDLDGRGIENLLEMRGNKMVARHVRRLDTGVVFRTCGSAAESVGGKMTGLYAAMQHGRSYRGVQFEYTDDAVTALPVEVTLVGSVNSLANSQGIVQTSMSSALVEGEIIGAITRLFEKLSSLATGMQVLKLTDLKISAGGMTVEAGSLEICSPAHR
jgi:hypothetical protein